MPAIYHGDFRCIDALLKLYLSPHKRAFASPFPRFLRRIEVAPSGCWLWKGNGTGYGQFSIGPVNIHAHVFSYIAFVGPIPSPLTVDHTCHCTRCVNPHHLRLLTGRDNVLSGVSTKGAAAKKRQTHCLRGHLFDQANTRIKRNGCRTCKKCSALASSQRRIRIQEQAAKTSLDLLLKTVT